MAVHFHVNGSEGTVTLVAKVMFFAFFVCSKLSTSSLDPWTPSFPKRIASACSKVFPVPSVKSLKHRPELAQTCHFRHLEDTEGLRDPALSTGWL